MGDTGINRDSRFSVDTFFELCQPAARVPMHLVADGSVLTITVQGHARPEEPRGLSGFTRHGVPIEMVASTVLVVDTLSGEVTRPFGGTATSWGGRWSPDGRTLAAYLQAPGEPACIAFWQRSSGAVSAVREAQVCPFFGFEVPRWTPDSSAVVVKLRPSRTSESGSVARRSGPARVYVFDPDDEPDPDAALQHWADGWRCDLALVEVESGAVKQLARDWRTWVWEVSPDGKVVGLMRYVAQKAELQQAYHDLMVLPVRGGEPTRLAQNIPQRPGLGFSWSLDSKRIAYATLERGRPQGLFVVAADGSRPPIELTPKGVAAQFNCIQEPRWSKDGSTLFCLSTEGHWVIAPETCAAHRVSVQGPHEPLRWIQKPSSRQLWTTEKDAIFYLLRDSQSRDLELARVDAETGSSELLASLRMSQANDQYGMEAAGDGTLYFLLEAADQPAALWRWHDGQVSRLATMNPQLDGMALAHARLIEHTSLDGRRLGASLLLPPGWQEGQRVPLLVVVYGGRSPSNLLHCFDNGYAILHPQLLAGDGYAVLLPDMPMTARDPMKQLPGLVLPAVTRAIELGIADPERIAVLGHSYGGYCVLGLVAQTGRFKAAVTSAAFSDLAAAATSMLPEGLAAWLGWAETGQGRMGGPPWERPNAYVENSPLFYLDRVTTPLLLVCGKEDQVADAQSEAVFVGLRRLGRRVMLAEYEGARHIPGSWSAENYRHLAELVLAWLRKELADD